MTDPPYTLRVGSTMRVNEYTMSSAVTGLPLLNFTPSFNVIV